MPETTWGTAILPATSKRETGSEMPPWATQLYLTSGCIQAPLLTRPTAGPGSMALTKQLWDSSLALIRPPWSVCKWG